jgi:hypothetical protein
MTPVCLSRETRPRNWLPYAPCPISTFSMGAGAAMSEGRKMRALTATKAKINTRTTSRGAMY